MTDRKDITKTENKAIEKTRELRTATPSVDIYENENEILLYADMPGAHKDDVTVNIENGKLSISGIRRLDRQGVSNWEEFVDVEYVRNFSIPQSINVEDVEAKLKDGVLTLHLPKSEAAKPRLIEIKAA
ncbi:Hsp20/alpha crystallin family protein [Desulfobacter hydrogenophilus]|uniref:Hsp20/alpha crystallin family protein n=1 Tax=Desulfobacter hydrogenophilus TaxID=2291 RepID=A0A328FHB9_9BACT|nr:Hsp20/alpha crystallin family protein [Desulfobacter hydrogenophilus]NDY72752.1 Hsp20/alpha crystallin family protein [Desulfobacter hydrogenophilus]QBH12984.1 Hsp20/alpha crystallin family protein [Desulfobacter hydrogenophilus]RAM03968.1 Hsp20/alpha crystallin family protein [Desulfobacter hydrogenophilus]